MALAVMVVPVTASETALNERDKNKARGEAARTAAPLRLLCNNALAQMSAPLGHLAKEHADAYGATGATPLAALTDAQRDDVKTALRSVLTGAVTLTAPIDAADLPTARSAFYRLRDRPGRRFSREPQDWAPRVDAVDGLGAPRCRRSDRRPCPPAPVPGRHTGRGTGAGLRAEVRMAMRSRFRLRLPLRRRRGSPRSRGWPRGRVRRRGGAQGVGGGPSARSCGL